MTSMKDILIFLGLIAGLILVILMPSGCALNCNQVMGHDSIWKSPAHAYFSIIGWKYMSVQDVNKSKAEGWWGCGVMRIEAAPDCDCD